MKIRKVNIVGFRSYAYEGDGLFDFTDSLGHPCDFVVIYGPNGFGKSSVYDAIEWSITNGISRYNRESQRTNNDAASRALNQKGTAQHILRNRSIADSDPAFVEVDTTTHGPFKREVKKARSGSRDYKFDLKDVDANTKHLADIFLSQDAIDSFLKEEKPEARYEKFMAGFGGEDELYRQKLFLLKRASRAEHEKIRTQIDTLKPELAETVDHHAIEHVKETLDRLKKNGFEFNFVGIDYNGAQHVQYQNKILEYFEKNSNKHKNLLSRIVLGNSVFSRIPEYTSIQERILLKEFDLSSAVKHRDLLVGVHQIRTSIEILEKDRTATLVSLNEQSARATYLENYLDLREKFRSASTVVKKLEEDRNKFRADLAEINSTVSSKNESLARADLNLSTTRLVEAGSAELFQELEAVEVSIRSLEQSRQTSIASKLELVTRKDRDFKILQELQSLVINELMPPNVVAKVTNNSNLEERFRALSDEKVRVLARLENYKNLLSQLVVLDARISELVKAGAEIATHTQDHNCPLCSHPYRSNEELLDRILAHEGLSKEQTPILALRAEDERVLVEIENNIRTLSTEVNEIRNKSISELGKNIDELGIKIDEYDQSLQRISVDSSKLNSRRLALIEKTGNLTYAQYKDKYEKLIADLIANCNSIRQELILLEARRLDFSSKLENIDAQIAFQSESLLNGVQDVAYSSMSDYIAANGVVDGGEHQFFSSNLNDLNSKIASANQSIQTRNEELESAQKELLQFTFPNDLTLLAEKINIATNELNELKASRLKILDAVRSIGGEIKQDESLVGVDELSEVVEIARNKLGLEQILCVEIESTLEVLGRQLELVLRLAENSRTAERIASLENELLSHESFEMALNDEFALVEKRLKHRINEFFYEDLINNIYAKIDPHPSFKVIDFSCVFPENGDKPRLEIYVREGDGDPISPNFYFSAAQLNVLSLSIFLARALHVQHKGESVQTILIDDPIQSMDSINILSTIDLLRGISKKFDRQIILSTHDENFFELLKMKVPQEKFKSKFIQLSEFGKVAV